MTLRAWPHVLAVSILLTVSMAAADSRPDGRAIYDRLCAHCHGATGKGDGPAVGLLMNRPLDFTTGVFKIRTTAAGSIPTDEDLARSIRDGLPGSSMSGFRDLLSEPEIRAVVDTVKSFSPRFATETAKPLMAGPKIARSAEVITAGREIYEKLECATCHGADGRGTGADGVTLRDDHGRKTEATDLTAPWAFRGGASAHDVYVRVKTGMAGTPMASFADAADDQELWQLAHYILSLARKPTWEMTADELRAHYTEEEAMARRNPVRHGRHIMYRVGCRFCHSPIREDGSIIEELALAGGQRWSTGAFGDFVSVNLTSDPETGIGHRTDEEIRRVITTGVRHDGTRMIPIMMPWHAYSHLTDVDLDGIVAYLRTLPPVRNRIPPNRYPGLVEYFWLKLRMMVFWEDVPLCTYPGNGGVLEEGSPGEGGAS